MTMMPIDAQEGGGTQDFTTITWQIGLGETLCYRFGSALINIIITVFGRH